MASGWSNDGAVQDQIDATVDDAIAHARSQLHQGDSAQYCEACGEPIPEARRTALPGVRYCVDCQEKLDRKNTLISGYNRRGSKDSQLR
ncbi:DksA/TraR family C4-type zinc finger protein [Musicola paradisiaca]|uniref:Transcriptional regulator, TraR/DksA family n=1 Tax=Musicola paradisiaca (strain Ech703) TaxID=579405 RepID=C6CAF4_MUSP7|nr:DksA/TraR family C4-type zinc finger protein [Musicola paradisiaca]ACS86452.1 transcriptional regulator, TraR/DksA family [Musicola paradisiaca Ech703]